MVLSKNKVELRGGAGGGADYSSDSLLHNQGNSASSWYKIRKRAHGPKQEAHPLNQESALVMTEETSKSRNQTSGRKMESDPYHTPHEKSIPG